MKGRMKVKSRPQAGSQRMLRGVRHQKLENLRGVDLERGRGGESMLAFGPGGEMSFLLSPI